MANSNTPPHAKRGKRYTPTAPGYKRETIELSWENLTQLLDSPLYYYRIYALIGGSANAGIWLSRAIYWSRVQDRTAPHKESWFYKSDLEWFLETGLTKGEQKTVRRDVVNLGLAKIQKRGMPATNHYQIQKEAILRQLAFYLPDQPAAYRRPSVRAKSSVQWKQFASALNTNVLPQRKSYSVETPATSIRPTNNQEAALITSLLNALSPTEREMLITLYERETEPAIRAGVATEHWLENMKIVVCRQYFKLEPPKK